MVRMLGGIGLAGGGRGCRGAWEPDRTHQSLRQGVMIGDGQTIGTQRISRHLANYNKQDLTIDTPYGVVTRRVKVTVDDTEVEISIIDPFAALWMITCPALGFLDDHKRCSPRVQYVRWERAL